MKRATRTLLERIAVGTLTAVLVVALGFVVAGVVRVTDTSQLSAGGIGDILNMVNGNVSTGDTNVSLQNGNLSVSTNGGAGGGDAQRPGGSGISTVAASNFDDIATEGSIRQVIQNWVNFFLGFLSIVAMVALVYAGFQYVSARGEDDQVATAKKSIAYVTVGILVIFMAWAFVNTLITYGPQGGDLAFNPADTLTAEVLHSAATEEKLVPYWQFEQNQ